MIPKKYVSLSLYIILVVVVLYMGSLPVSHSPYPYGENDAAHHWGRTNYYVTTDNIDNVNPYYSIASWYIPPKKEDFWVPLYPMSYFMNQGIMRAIFGNDDYASNVILGFFSLLLIPTVLFLIFNRLFGPLFGFFAGLLVLFDTSVLLKLLWGQRPLLLTFPFILASYYMYFRFVQTQKYKYLILTSLFAVAICFYHPAGVLFPFLGVALYTGYFLIKNKKLPFAWYHPIIPIILFVLLFIPTIGNITSFGHTEKLSEQLTEHETINLKEFFEWFVYENYENPQIRTYSSIMGGYWTLPLLLLGLLFIILKRSEKNRFILIFVLSTYFLFHIESLGYRLYNMDRFFELSGMAFTALVILGFVLVWQLCRRYKMIQYGLAIAFIVLLIIFNAIPQKEFLENSYSGPLRINDEQSEFITWAHDHLSYDLSTRDPQELRDVPFLYYIGAYSYAKIRFIQSLSQVPMYFITLTNPQSMNITEYYTTLTEENLPLAFTPHFSHIVFDYSDAKILGNNEILGWMQYYEETFPINKSLIYNKNNIRVYALE
jgi:hypothetical protein